MTLNTADAVYVGDIAADRVYLGDTLVWELEQPETGWGPDEFIFASETTPAGTSPQSFPFTFGIRFTPVVDGRITGVRFYSYTAVTGRQVSIWSDTGAKLAHGVGGVEVGVGWQVIPLDEPLSVKAGVPLVTSYGWHNSWGQFGYTVEQTPVSASPNLVAEKGSYHQGDMDSFPSMDGGQHYYADVVFQEVVGVDPDTQRFLDATGLPEGYAPALDGLVRGLKSAGLWAKMKAVYPFVGGTADLHKWNLIDPRDADDAYRLTYSLGSGGHSTDLGYKPNAAPDAAPGYADTHLVPAGLLDPTSVHLSLYSLTPLSNAPRCDMGAFNWNGANGRFHLIVHYTAGEFYYSLGHGGTQNVSGGDGSGLYVSSRTSASAEVAYRNGLALGSNSNAPVELPPVSVLIGALNSYWREYSDLAFGFASIGSGLDAQNVADLNSVVQDYQVAVRQVQPFSPFDIAGLMLWFDAAQVVATDGELLTSWSDASMYGFIGEVVSAAKPAYRADGINGHPALHFGAQGFTEMRVVHGRTIGSRTVFQVLKTVGPPFGGSGWHTTQVQELDPFLQTYGGATIHTYTTNDLDSGVPWSGQAQFITLWADSVQATHWLEVDGLQKSTAWAPAASASNLHFGGFQPGGYASNSHIGEVLVYERSLTPSERDDVLGYLQQKWAP